MTDAFNAAWRLVKREYIEGRTHDDDGNALPWYEKTPSWFKIDSDEYDDDDYPMCENPGCDDIAVWEGLFGSDTGYYCADHGPSLSEQKTGSSAPGPFADNPDSADRYAQDALRGLLDDSMPRGYE